MVIEAGSINGKKVEIEVVPIKKVEIEVSPINNEKKEVVDWSELFDDVPQIATPLLEGAKNSMKKIEKLLYCAPNFLDALTKKVPEGTLQAVLTNDQKKQLANGTLKLMHKKDGSLLAVLINPQNKRTVAQLPLKYVENSSKELNAEMANFAVQMKLAQIAKQIHEVQIAVEAVLQGQESDRLATAYSCQQKFLQAQKIGNSELKRQALLHIAFSAEDSRNLLMQSQLANLEFIKNQPEDFWGKLLKGAKPEKIDSKMSQIRESFAAINTVSITEALAYQEMGEYETARQSLLYYSDFLKRSYLSEKSLVNRLDSIDPSPDNYWSEILPSINKGILALPCADKELELNV